VLYMDCRWIAAEPQGQALRCIRNGENLLLQPPNVRTSIALICLRQFSAHLSSSCGSFSSLLMSHELSVLAADAKDALLELVATANSRHDLWLHLCTYTSIFTTASWDIAGLNARHIQGLQPLLGNNC
jgi:hypothetical protein